jgi:hypothetical protein
MRFNASRRIGNRDYEECGCRGVGEVRGHARVAASKKKRQRNRIAKRQEHRTELKTELEQAELEQG